MIPEWRLCWEPKEADVPNSSGTDVFEGPRLWPGFGVAAESKRKTAIGIETLGPSVVSTSECIRAISLNPCNSSGSGDEVNSRVKARRNEVGEGVMVSLEYVLIPLLGIGLENSP